MRAETKKKSSTDIRDEIQSDLEHLLQEACDQFFKLEDVNTEVLLDPDLRADITSGALLTLFTKRIAFTSAQSGEENYTEYLQAVYDAMVHLFVSMRKTYVKHLKDKSESPSSLQ